jgi:hypothetical protein
MAAFEMGWAGPMKYGIVPACRESRRGIFSGGRTAATTMRAHGPAHFPQESMMRFYSQPHAFYCGVDLHARTMYLCILDSAGAVVLHQNLPSDPKRFLKAIAPFRDGLVVCCGTTSTSPLTWKALACCTSPGITTGTAARGTTRWTEPTTACRSRVRPIRPSPCRILCSCPSSCSPTHLPGRGRRPRGPTLPGSRSRSRSRSGWRTPAPTTGPGTTSSTSTSAGRTSPARSKPGTPKRRPTPPS